jgi:hypothetical protein
MLYESEYPATVSRIETEMNVGWIANNPELFKTSYDNFFNEHNSTDWKISSRITKGTITLVAIRLAA